MSADRPLPFGTLLRRYRRAAGLTQEALAERAALSVFTVSALERGSTQGPRKETLLLLAEALGLVGQERAALETAARGPVAEAPSPAAAPTAVPLIGRARELALLERHLAGDGPPVLVLAGEPGIGKSRLLREATERARTMGWCVLEGGCQRQGGQAPYAPLLEALERHIRQIPPARLPAELQGCAWLVRLLPELAEIAPAPAANWTLPPAQERRLMFGAVGRYLSNIAGPRGTMLVLDDLQWSGADALDLLAALVRSPDVPARVVAAYRDTETQPGDPLSSALADLAAAALAAQQTLGPLAPDETERLLDSLLGVATRETMALREHVTRRAGGVPFFMVSCAQALQAGAGPQHDHAVGVPWTVAQGVRQRVAALPKAAREGLSLAAVIGRIAPRWLLLALAAQPEEAVLDALAEACRARLLAEEDGADAYRFAHDVVREVVEADLGTARRAMLHRRVAEALERRDVAQQEPYEPPVEALAYHFARSEARDRAALYLEQAGDRARSRYAHTAAAAYYADAMDRLDRLGRHDNGARVREKLADVLTTLARYEEALPLLERTADLYGASGDLEGLRRTLAQIGRTHVNQGTAAAGIARLRAHPEAQAVTEASAGLAALYAVLALLFAVCGRYDELSAAAEQAVSLARTAGDDFILAEALRVHGLAVFAAGRIEEYVRVTEEAVRVGERAGNLESVSRALASLDDIYTKTGEFDKAQPYLERALEVAERLGDPVQIAFILMNKAELSFYSGEWEQAWQIVARAATLCDEVGASWMSAYPLLQRGQLCLAQGAWDEATAYLEQAVAIAEQNEDPQALLAAVAALAERDLLDGHPEAAHGRMAPLLAQHDPAMVHGAALLVMQAWAHLDLGDLAQAGDVIRQVIERMRATNYRIDLVKALYVQAMLLVRTRRWAKAARTLEEALSLARGVPYPHAEARLLHMYGLLHAAKGQPGHARERLEAALAIARRLGAHKDVERVEQALAECRIIEGLLPQRSRR